MTSDNTGGEHGDFRHLTAEMLQHLATQRGIDFSQECSAKVGFLGALIATMARAGELSAEDRSLHAESMFELARTLFPDGGDTAFATGWNLGVETQLVVMDSYAKAGDLSQAGLDNLAHSSAQLSLVPPTT